MSLDHLSKIYDCNIEAFIKKPFAHETEDYVLQLYAFFFRLSDEFIKGRIFTKFLAFLWKSIYECKRSRRFRPLRFNVFSISKVVLNFEVNVLQRIFCHPAHIQLSEYYHLSDASNQFGLFMAIISYV